MQISGAGFWRRLLYSFVSSSNPEQSFANGHTFTTRGASLAMADRLLSLLAFASTAFLGSTWGFVLPDMAADVLVYDVGAHVEGFRGWLDAHSRRWIWVRR